MGSPEGEGFDEEKPRHSVEITRAFQMAAVPVTNAQYAAFAQGTSTYQASPSNFPSQSAK